MLSKLKAEKAWFLKFFLCQYQTYKKDALDKVFKILFKGDYCSK